MKILKTIAAAAIFFAIAIISYFLIQLITIISLGVNPLTNSIKPIENPSNNNCAKEGEIAINGSCCPELKPLKFAYKDSRRENKCIEEVEGMPTCTNCGDGFCKSGETECNCPQDCNQNMETTCAALCQIKGYSDSYCSVYGGGLIAKGETVAQSCAEGGNNIGQSSDCNNQQIVDAGKTCCCLKWAPKCKNEGEIFDSNLSTTICCANLINVYIYSDYGKNPDDSEFAVPTGKSACVNCGNNKCDTNESKASCPQDCQGEKKKCNITSDCAKSTTNGCVNGLWLDNWLKTNKDRPITDYDKKYNCACINYACKSKPTSAPETCGNLRCDAGESESICPEDCPPSTPKPKSVIIK